MELNEVLDFLKENAFYRGRSVAYYEDGREFGVVTMIGIQEPSNFLCKKVRVIVFSEKNHIVLSIDAKSPVNILKEWDAESKFTLPLAPYGKTYRYSFETEDGKTIYISPFE